MPWILFHQNYDFQKTRHVTTAYKAGNRYLVSQIAADAAIAAGVGVEVDSDGNPIGDGGTSRRRSASDKSGRK